MCRLAASQPDPQDETRHPTICHYCVAAAAQHGEHELSIAGELHGGGDVRFTLGFGEVSRAATDLQCREAGERAILLNFQGSQRYFIQYAPLKQTEWTQPLPGRIGEDAGKP
jgi:hypothetical protein